MKTINHWINGKNVASKSTSPPPTRRTARVLAEVFSAASWR